MNLAYKYSLCTYHCLHIAKKKKKDKYIGSHTWELNAVSDTPTLPAVPVCPLPRISLHRASERPEAGCANKWELWRASLYRLHFLPYLRDRTSLPGESHPFYLTVANSSFNYAPEHVFHLHIFYPQSSFPSLLNNAASDNLRRMCSLVLLHASQ